MSDLPGAAAADERAAAQYNAIYTDAQPLAAGDIVFYSGADWEDVLIQRMTGGGMFSHCEIVVAPAADEGGDALTIGALGLSGTVRHPLPIPYAAVAHTGARLSNAGRARGLAWLASRVGARYGWLDVLADGFQSILPRWLGNRAPFLIAPSQMDCSTFASQFLIIAGYPLAIPLELDPHRVSPNSLWGALQPEGRSA